jgi:hypothetical protein
VIRGGPDVAVEPLLNDRAMGIDVFAQQGRCRYCDRPAALRWGTDVLSCRHETCESLAFAEARRRCGNLGPASATRAVEYGRRARALPW